MEENLDLRPNPPVPAVDYDREGHDMAHESNLDPDALGLRARQIVVESAAERDREQARLNKQLLDIPVAIERKLAALAASAKRLKDEFLHPEDSREAKARELDRLADAEQAKLRHDLGLLVFSVLAAAISYLYYGSALGTALNFGAKLEAADSASKLLALTTSILDPRGIFDALLAGNPLPATFPALPLAIAYLGDKFAVARRRFPLALCVLVILAIDVALGYGVTKNLHEVSVISGLEPDVPWTFLDALLSWKFALVVAVGFGTTIAFALLNHLRNEERRVELARIASIRDKAQQLRSAVEADRENLVRIPQAIRELSAMLKAAESALKAVASLSWNDVEAKLAALLGGWMRYGAFVYSEDEVRLAKVKQDAEDAISKARKLLKSQTLDESMERLLRSIDPKWVQA